MTRWTSTTNETAAAQEHVSFRLLVKLDFVSGFVYAHDGVGTITFAGNDYLGVADFGSMEAVTEDLDVIARPLTLYLSGKAEYLSSAMTERYQGRTATLYIALVDANNVLVDTPEIAWEGYMDKLDYDVEDGEASIELTCENRLAREPRIARYTSEDLQREYAGDLFFERLPKIPGHLNQWGSDRVNYGFGGGIRNGPSGGGVTPNKS